MEPALQSLLITGRPTNGHSLFSLLPVFILLPSPIFKAFQLQVTAPVYGRHRDVQPIIMELSRPRSSLRTLGEDIDHPCRDMDTLLFQFLLGVGWIHVIGF